MNYQSKKEQLQLFSKREASVLLSRIFPDIQESYIESDLGYFAWPESFGSTAGPFGGIGGQAISTFTMEAWEFMGAAVLFCQGKKIKVVEKWQPMSMRSQ